MTDVGIHDEFCKWVRGSNAPKYVLTYIPMLLNMRRDGDFDDVFWCERSIWAKLVTLAWFCCTTSNFLTM